MHGDWSVSIQKKKKNIIEEIFHLILMFLYLGNGHSLGFFLAASFQA
jgi:hypothetical protein